MGEWQLDGCVEMECPEMASCSTVCDKLINWARDRGMLSESYVPLVQSSETSTRESNGE